MARAQVGIRELKNRLSRYLARVRRGDEIIVTQRGTPVARLIAVSAASDPLAALMAEGLIEPPQRRKARRLPRPRLRLRGHGPSMAAYVARQRR